MEERMWGAEEKMSRTDNGKGEERRAGRGDNERKRNGNEQSQLEVGKEGEDATEANRVIIPLELTKAANCQLQRVHRWSVHCSSAHVSPELSPAQPGSSRSAPALLYRTGWNATGAGVPLRMILQAMAAPQRSSPPRPCCLQTSRWPWLAQNGATREHSL